MATKSAFLRRDPADAKPWPETCGEIRCLVEEKDGAAAEVHQVKIHDAKLHYHERTDEFYYVIDGSGTMVLDDETIELHKGVVVYVPRGVKHKAIGELTVLTVCIPRGVLSRRSRAGVISPRPASCPPTGPLDSWRSGKAVRDAKIRARQSSRAMQTRQMSSLCRRPRTKRRTSSSSVWPTCSTPAGARAITSRMRFEP